jgi:PAS domain S-box-containing protein
MILATARKALLRTRSLTLPAIGVLTVLTGTFVGVQTFEAIGSVQRFYQVEVQGLRTAGEMAFQIQEGRRTVTYALTTEDPNQQVAYVEQARTAGDMVEQLKQLLLTSPLDTRAHRTLAAFWRQWNEYLQIRDQIIATILVGDKQQALALDFSQAHPAFERAKDSLMLLETQLDRSAGERLGYVTRALYRSMVEIALLLGAMLLFLKTIAASQERRRTVDALRQINSDLENTQRNLRDQELRLRTLFNNVLDAIITIDVDGAVENTNHAAGVLFGCPAAELVGTPFEAYVPGFQARLENAANRPDLTQGFRSWPPIEMIGKKKNGAELLVEISSSEFLDHNRKEVLTAVIRDVTERRELERQLAHAQKLESIGQLAAGIAHEINTPIQYIGDNARFLEDSFRDVLSFVARERDAARTGAAHAAPAVQAQHAADDEALAYFREEIPRAIEQSIEGIEQVARIVRAMKEFSHPGPVEKMPIDINRAIESTTVVSRNEWKYVADVTMDLDPEVPPIPCVAGEFNQVILNLVVNAAHAIADVVRDSGNKGRIHIQTRRDEGCVEIRVSDTGCGIPPAIQSKVFDPFFTTKPVGKGTGQGLAIAHAVIVKKHNGTIGLESAPGQGTTFIIRVPFAEQEEAIEV